MSLRITIRNRQKTRPLDLHFFRRILQTLLREQLETSAGELCFHLVAAAEMSRLNQTFLHHEGSTDVITFDHVHGVPLPRDTTVSKRLDPQMQVLHGEIFICVDDAIIQSRQFRTTWQSEIVRYAVHGVLHLLGHDDQKPANRRAMKREENRLLRLLARRFAFGKLSR